MLALERRNQIYEKLQRDKKVVVGELSQFYNVTEETIRRDLEKLEKEGLVIKSYGGAILNENTNIDLPYNIRKKHNVSGKQKIAKLVESLVHSGDCIMLDASSTSVFIARALKKKDTLTVVTNSVEVMIELADKESWNVISTGGRIKNGGLAMEGAKAVESIREYHVEKVIISAKAFDICNGFTDSSEETVGIKHAMLQSGRERIVAIDSSNFEKTAFCKIADLQEIDYIVTDKKPDEKILQFIGQENVKILYPEE